MEGKQEGAALADVAMQQMDNTVQETVSATERLLAPSSPKRSAIPMSALIRQVIDKAEQKKAASGCNSPPPSAAAAKSPSASKRPPPLVPPRKLSPPHEGSNSNDVSHPGREMTATPPTERRQDLPKVNLPALKKPLLPPRAPGGSQRPTVGLTCVQSKSTGLALVDEGGGTAESTNAKVVLESHSSNRAREATAVQPSQPPGEGSTHSKAVSVPTVKPVTPHSPPTPPTQESKPTEQNGEEGNEVRAVEGSPVVPRRDKGGRRLRHRSSAMSLHQKPASLQRSSTTSESDQFEGGDNVMPETPASATGFLSDASSSDDFVRVSLKESDLMGVSCVCVCFFVCVCICVCVCVYMSVICLCR